MENQTQVACPECRHRFMVGEALASQYKDQITSQLRAEYKLHFEKLKADEQRVQQQQQLIEEQRTQMEQVIAEKLTAEKLRLQQELKVQLLEEHQTELTALREDNERKKQQVLEFKQKEIDLVRQRNQLAEREQDLQLSFEKKLAQAQQQQELAFRERLQQELLDREAEIVRKTTEETQQHLKVLNEEVLERRQKMAEMAQRELEFERQKRQHEEEKQQLQLQYERQQTEIRKQLEEQISRQVNEQADFKLREKDEIIRQMREQVEEAKRRAEQGSMQLQGEVQELALEELLRTHFPKDDISEVEKGIRGADVVQTVRNNHWQDCGKILYESKRTKHFSNDWITKLKEDRLRVKADLCIIVTEALPEGIERIGQKDEVWICTFQEVRGLTMALRELLICCHQVTASQTNKGEKMQMLYDYLTSNEFRAQLMAIVEGFKELEQELVTEKRQVQQRWAKREKQLNRVLENTVSFYGSIRGIAGNAVPAIKSLEGENDAPEVQPLLLETLPGTENGLEDVTASLN